VARHRDILQITRIYGHGPDRQIEARRRQPDGTWTAKFTIPARYAGTSATLGYATTVYAAQGRTVDVAHALITAGILRQECLSAASRPRPGGGRTSLYEIAADLACRFAQLHACDSGRVGGCGLRVPAP